MNNGNHKSKNIEDSQEVSNKPLSDDELSSLIKASKESKFNEIELKLKKNENESFKKITLHDIAKQATENKNKEEIIQKEKSLDNINNSVESDKKKR